ncbi:hypothetical protein BH24ACT9_BH24ACT9_10880 [soil metagenome]
MRRLPRSRAGPAALLLAALLLGSACSAGQIAETRQQAGSPIQVGDISLHDVEFATPRDRVYEVGEAAQLTLAIVHSGLEDEYLVDVSSPAFDAVAVDDAEPDSPFSITIPGGGVRYTGTSGEADIIAIGMSTDLRTTESFPVTFTFSRAGEVTAETYVSAPLRLTLDRLERELAADQPGYQGDVGDV